MKFSIRDLLLVTVIVALAVGWWVDHQQEAATKHEVEKDAAELANQLAWRGYVHTERMDALMNKYQPKYREVLDELADSSAPAPNPPKD
jgi:hypothetical protein